MTLERMGQCCLNPYESAAARAHSAYARFEAGKLTHPLAPETPATPLEEFVHDSFRALVLNPWFACVAAKGAFHRDSYRMGVYDDMASPEVTAGLARDLFAFVQDQDVLEEEGSRFSTFVASFQGPCVFDEEIFERLLWTQLQQLHDLDAAHSPWDAKASADPNDPAFAFSFGGRAFYIIGLHPAASRWSRRFAWPTLVFNAHFQFDRLKEDGRYAPMQTAIRTRDRALQGSNNAMLAEFGERSEARQYSGRGVDDEWRCPFHAGSGGSQK